MSLLTRFDKWSELPAEVRLECINRTPVLTRILFRHMSRSDRDLVASSHFSLEKLSLTDISYGPILEAQPADGQKFKLIAEKDNILNEQFVPLLAFLVKNGTIENFLCEIPELSDAHIEVLQSNLPYKIKEFEGWPTALSMLFLERCSNSLLREVTLTAQENGYMPIAEILAFQSTRNVMHWLFHNVQDSQVFSMLADMWIERDAPFGASLEVTMTRAGAFEDFKERYAENIDSEKRYSVLLATNECNKKILLRKHPKRKTFGMYTVLFPLQYDILHI